MPGTRTFLSSFITYSTVMFSYLHSVCYLPNFSGGVSPRDSLFQLTVFKTWKLILISLFFYCCVQSHFCILLSSINYFIYVVPHKDWELCRYHFQERKESFCSFNPCEVQWMKCWQKYAYSHLWKEKPCIWNTFFHHWLGIS